jgi:hypothetical protein
MPPPAIPNAKQLKTLEVLQRIKMAWVTLYVILGLFTVGFGAFLVSVFMLPGDGISKSILGGIDLLLGWSLRAVVGNLFPRPPKHK